MRVSKLMTTVSLTSKVKPKDRVTIFWGSFMVAFLKSKLLLSFQGEVVVIYLKLYINKSF